MENSGTRSGSGRDGDIYRVGVKVPPFWADEPELWFAQLEGQFTLSNITQDATRYFYVLAHLDPCYATHVKDVIRSPPSDGKYLKLKEELIKRLSESNEKKLKQLFMHEEMGDRRPSQFLRHLRDLAGPSVADDILRTLWTGRLPTALQTVVALQSKLPLDDIAELADRVHEIAAPTPFHNVASTSSPALPSSSASSSQVVINELNAQVCELTRQVAKLTAQVSRGSRSRSRSRHGHRRHRTRSGHRQPPADHPHCWYHYHFGAKANKCQQPCTFSAENSRGSRK